MDPAASEWTIAGTTIKRELDKRWIGYTGPSGTIPRLSMNVLLQPDALANPAVQALKGKVVILAANNAGSSDRHFTPYSRGSRADQMAGGEIHANIVETMLSGHYPKVPPLWLRTTGIFILLSLLTVLFVRLPPERGALIGLFIAVNIPIPAFAMFFYDYVLPVAEPQMGLVVAFLITLGMRLTGEERERARMKRMFGSYVSDEVVDMLLMGGRKLTLGGETVPVTVMFSDIRNFTTISEKLAAHEVVEMLNEYFSRVTAPILDQRGNVNKCIGDAVMAIFGSPVTYPDHARRAITAALGMVRAAESFRDWMEERFPDRGLPRFGIGIGLHSGDAVMGNIGSVKRLEYTAIGDTVNAASRLEGVTKEMGCVLVASAQTVRAAGPACLPARWRRSRSRGATSPSRCMRFSALNPSRAACPRPSCVAEAAHEAGRRLQG
ncbi:MAG: adenylate/guanylate cyclase domain-containing protein [Betaproteobacteria bacterium]|nr:adenylate/guanylate cyclase domain-containing protein [Betaproteobacteria bacterium]